LNSPVSKILIVDDHVLFREGLISAFRSAPDFEVVGEAGGVYEGLQLVRQLIPDIVLMDFNLPDGTGLDATRVITEEFPQIKIVFLTIYETDENLLAAIRLGASGFLLKNIASVNLITSLRALNRDEMALSRKLSSRVIKAFSQNSMTDGKSKEEIERNLSTRELGILRELESGASNQEIAQRLFISENTVKHHIGSILEKLGVENRRQAALLARQNGIVHKSSP
jgi:two-component system, NarL family, nitrate/nitrite response regulator NarL